MVYAKRLEHAARHLFSIFPFFFVAKPLSHGLPMHVLVQCPFLSHKFVTCALIHVFLLITVCD